MTKPMKEVNITHLYNASPDDVFRAWTNPAFLKQWYAPDGCTISFTKMDIRVGGKIHSCINNPHFGSCWCVSEYLEIVPNQKLVFTMENTDEKGNPIDPTSLGMDPDWPGKSIVTILLSEENGKTKLELKQTVSEELAIKTGAYPGWLQMLNKLNTALHSN